MSKGASESVRVFVRCRPFNKLEKSKNCDRVVFIKKEVNQVQIKVPGEKDRPPKNFTFDGVYNPGTQVEVYDETSHQLVSNVIDGFNGTIFAYGQTGCGKSYSMMGVLDVEEQRGIIPKSFNQIFDTIAANTDKSKRYLVRGAFIEIYNEEVRDLLSKDFKQALAVKEHPEKGVFVQGLTHTVVKSAAELNVIMEKGNNNRTVGFTKMNAGSSRSHSIFILHVETVTHNEQTGDDQFTVGKLNLVDLAGSERQSKTGAEGVRLKEATKINLSLSALGNVISALVAGKSKHIPYRDSKLTRLLQDSLGGNTKTVMIAAVSPADYNYDETLSTLRYANRAKNIKNKPVKNEDPKDALLREYQEEIQRLKAMLEAQQNGLPLPASPTPAPAAEGKEKKKVQVSATGEVKVVEDDVDTNKLKRELLKVQEDQKRKSEELNTRLQEERARIAQLMKEREELEKEKEAIQAKAIKEKEAMQLKAMREKEALHAMAQREKNALREEALREKEALEQRLRSEVSGSTTAAQEEKSAFSLLLGETESRPRITPVYPPKSPAATTTTPGGPSVASTPVHAKAAAGSTPHPSKAGGGSLLASVSALPPPAPTPSSTKPNARPVEFKLPGNAVPTLPHPKARNGAINSTDVAPSGAGSEGSDGGGPNTAQEIVAASQHQRRKKNRGLLSDLPHLTHGPAPPPAPTPLVTETRTTADNGSTGDLEWAAAGESIELEKKINEKADKLEKKLADTRFMAEQIEEQVKQDLKVQEEEAEALKRIIEKEREQARNEKEDFQKQLKLLQEKLLGQSRVRSAGADRIKSEAKMKAKREAEKKRELEALRLRKMEEKKTRAENAQRQAKQQEQQVLLEEKYGNVQEEVKGKTKKLKKLRQMYKLAKEELKGSKQEIKDLQDEFENEREGYLNNIREIYREMALQKQILKQVLPASLISRIQKEAQWDDENEIWNLPAIEMPTVFPRISRRTPSRSIERERPAARAGTRSGIRWSGASAERGLGVGVLDHYHPSRGRSREVSRNSTYYPGNIDIRQTAVAKPPARLKSLGASDRGGSGSGSASGDVGNPTHMRSRTSLSPSPGMSHGMGHGMPGGSGPVGVARWRSPTIRKRQRERNALPTRNKTPVKKTLDTLPRRPRPDLSTSSMSSAGGGTRSTSGSFSLDNIPTDTPMRVRFEPAGPIPKDFSGVPHSSRKKDVVDLNALLNKTPTPKPKFAPAVTSIGLEDSSDTSLRASLRSSMNAPTITRPRFEPAKIQVDSPTESSVYDSMNLPMRPAFRAAKIDEPFTSDYKGYGAALGMGVR
uniref:Kinesin motor domain-containing protein n=1 Tax=Lotharella globosa TaxID=91324 RepID=A0A7S3Z776_9EUKA